MPKQTSHKLIKSYKPLQIAEESTRRIKARSYEHKEKQSSMQN